MGITVQRIVRCDTCGNEYITSSTRRIKAISTAELISRLRKSGYLVGKYITCSNCAKKMKAKEIPWVGSQRWKEGLFG